MNAAMDAHDKRVSATTLKRRIMQCVVFAVWLGAMSAFLIWPIAR